MTVAPTIAVIGPSAAWHATPASVNAAARPNQLRFMADNLLAHGCLAFCPLDQPLDLRTVELRDKRTRRAKTTYRLPCISSEECDPPPLYVRCGPGGSPALADTTHREPMSRA